MASPLDQRMHPQFPLGNRYNRIFHTNEGFIIVYTCRNDEIEAWNIPETRSLPYQRPSQTCAPSRNHFTQKTAIMGTLNDSDSNNLRYIIEHVFLPPKVPDEKDEDSVTKDSSLISEVSRIVIKFQNVLTQSSDAADSIGPWKIISRMIESMKKIHSTYPLKSKIIKNGFTSMKLGEITFECFELSLPNEVVMGTIGKVVTQYPANHRLVIPADEQLYDPLANAISFLSGKDIKETAPTIQKGGETYPNPRDTVSPRYITECLAGVLRAYKPDSIFRSDANETAFIRKRIDDHVVMGPDKALPWRRSPMWLLIRVSMQTTLQDHNVLGNSGYKVFQAYFMASLLEQCIGQPHPDIVPDDVIDFMNRKLGRRMWKMKQTVDSQSSPALVVAGGITAKISEALNSRWEQERRQSTASKEWTSPTPESIEEGLNLSLKTNQEYIRTVFERTDWLKGQNNDYNEDTTIRTLVSQCTERLDLDDPDLPTSINTAELEIGLMDFESWVQKQLPDWSESSERSSEDCKPLSDAISEYTEHGMSHYAKSPERMSLFWLTVMELWVALDSLVITKWDPLLKDYSPEFPEDFLDCLLLPLASQMKRLHRVQSYIRSRHAASRYRHSAFDAIDSPHSFQNVYFARSDSLQARKRSIEEWTSEEKRKVEEDLEDKNDEYKDLLTKASSISCEYYKNRTRWGGYVDTHSSGCRKCRFERDAENLEISNFEYPLPSYQCQANSLVFELYCPEPYGVWRETTYEILLSAFSHSSTLDSKLYELGAYIPTKRFYHARNLRLSAASLSGCIARISHSRASKIPAAQYEVIRSHSGRYQLCHNGGWLQSRGESKLRPLCTLRLDPPYKSLGAFIANTTHTPNSVIASQHNCPVSLNLSEYVAFGQLRSGNNIQVWNVMRAIMSESLSLNEAGVHSLLMQTVWQAGPNHQTRTWYRDAHRDLVTKDFANDMQLMIRDALGKVGDSSHEILRLATLTALTTRLLSLNPESEIRESLLELLEAFRNKASGWMKAAEVEMKASNSSKQLHRMALISVVWRSTFDVEDDVLETLCSVASNIETLLFTGATIAADSTQTGSLSQAIQLLFRRDRHLAHRLESHITRAIKTNPEPLDAVTQRVWESYERDSGWTRLPNKGHRWWKCRTIATDSDAPHSVFVNVLSGDILVDGKPVGRLPDSYISHDTYQRLFDRKISLRCFPSKMRGMEYGASYSGIQMHFAMINDSLVIRVRLEDGVAEYIPPSKLKGDVPSSLLLKHHHWFIERKHSIIRFGTLEFEWLSDDPKIWIMALTRNGGPVRGDLHRTMSFGLQERVLDPHSDAFKNVHNAVKGVESSPLDTTAISTTSDTENSRLQVALTNHNLEFFVNLEGHLESRSFPDYILDTNQDIGSLYGLESRMVLCDKSSSGRARKVVIPRGYLEARKGTIHHPIIRVNTKNITGFHVYNVDSLVGRLLGNGTVESDLFLIQLHAFTASHCPDPLTNRTGTEEALEALESASLVSHFTLSRSWRSQMERLAAISPRRTYYPNWSNEVEQIQWDPVLPAASQHPGFEEQVARILLYWSELDLNGDNTAFTQDLESPPRMEQLSRRATTRELRTTRRHSALQSHKQEDSTHAYRDVMGSAGSREREGIAYEVALCTHNLLAGLPHSSIQDQVIKNWISVDPSQSWSWQDFHEWFEADGSKLWSTLYEHCRDAPRNLNHPRFHIAVALSMLAYQGEIPLPVIGTLVAIICDPEFQDTSFFHPVETELDFSLGFRFDESKISKIVTTCQIPFDDSVVTQAPWSTYQERRRKRHEEYASNVKQEVNGATRQIKQRFPQVASTLTGMSRLQNLEQCLRDNINPLLQNWNRNKQFLDHLARVERQVAQAQGTSIIRPTEEYRPLPAQFLTPHDKIVDFTFEDLMEARNPAESHISFMTVTMPIYATATSATSHNLKVEKLHSFEGRLSTSTQGRIEERYRADFVESVNAFSTMPPVKAVKIPNVAILNVLRQEQEDFHLSTHKQILAILQPCSLAEEVLENTGLWPRVTAHALLSRLSLRQRDKTVSGWIEVISLYADQIIAVQRSRRLCHYGIQSMLAEYIREVLHGRPRLPLPNLDWLLIEIDADICIRSDQTEVANAMISPQNDENMVTQLNMGEGKSSVIVPVAAATLANTTQLVRVIVLKPQSKLQLDLLRRRVARLVDRRIIYLPFSRDLNPDSTIVSKISHVLDACLAEGGIWLCQPEHVCSFKLLGLDLAMRGTKSLDDGLKLIERQRWLQDHTRDILDESDEILHTHHQLVYTVGRQRMFDGGPTRWEMLQQIFELLRKEISSQPSDDFLVGPLQHPGQFPSTRMISNHGSEIFQRIVKATIFDRKIPSISTFNLREDLKNAAVLLVTKREAARRDKKVLELQDYCHKKKENAMWQSLLLLRGLIAFNILPMALHKKRWKVEYGRDLSRSRLAVPYRAKDSPSLRSDFAHPDVLIILTCLTYYSCRTASRHRAVEPPSRCLEGVVPPPAAPVVTSVKRTVHEYHILIPYL
ncbi:hypothetical protein M408DRAFT_130638 [Serendipita vermifera MAFF 305830]|uniref:ubiquitinyl hydrolase 1 n=1 Tax=Serendipita vermifera MAFF 305830 TaxID=933852 RepID=A0A0C2W205_SERVB|nr:hypothetical protein M408DRAFT_130638 [Serendipita vermifera MAFF 305830]